MGLLRRALSLVLAASVALSGGVGAPAAFGAAPKSVERGGPLAVRIGQTDGLTHIDFPGQRPSASRREGQDLILTFPHAAASDDLTHFKLDPTRYVKAVAVKSEGRGLQLRLTLADGVDAKLGRVDDAWTISLFSKTVAPTATAAAPKDQLPGARVDPAPAGGQMRMQPELQGQTLLLRFPWRAPLGAALFRRGDAIWMVFDAKAVIDVSSAPRGRPQFRKIEAFQGADYAAVRILAPVTTMASATAQGGVWTLALGPAAGQPSGPVAIGRDDSTGLAVLTADVAGSTGVFWVADPAVGDRMAVVTALPPAKGLPSPRSFVDATLLSSIQGLAVSPAVDDLQVSTDGDVVRIGRPKGLALSSVHAADQEAAATLGVPQAAPMPALVDFDGWSKTGKAGFLPRYNQLLTLAADEEGKGKSGSVGVRLGLARFLVGSELSFEALGVLDMVARSDQTILGDAEFRGLRGAARAMAGRYKDAQADFSSPVLADDPASSLWRGYIAEKLGDHAGARQQFSAGRRALPMFSEKWRGRFAETDAFAALGVNDLAGAHAAIVLAGALNLDPTDATGLKLAQARLMEAQGQGAQALPLYDQVAASDYGALSTPAALHAVQIRLSQGKLSSADAEATLGSLRFRWRGDATELDTVRALGRLYLAEGRYREALEVLRSANGRLPELASAVAISNDLSNIFKALFLQGQADGLQPIQALALFYDFKSLTPIGADGDQMVRKLARRLVSVDLLDQAADLLKYQVDNRLDGVPKAEVSTDLAMIDLMAKRPEDALGALNNSRTTLLPTALNARRRLIEARAHLALGGYDNALELIENDKSPEAAAIRAEIVWKQKNWPAAGALFEAQLGDRWKSPGPLTGEEQGTLVRAGTAYSLAGDDKSLARLRVRYGRLADTGTAPNLIKVALEGVDAGQLTATDFARAASDAAVFAGWVEAMKRRFATSPSPFSGGVASTAQAGPVTKPNAKPPAKQGA